MTTRNLVAEIAALALGTETTSSIEPDYASATLDLSNLANTPISSVRRSDVQLGYGVATAQLGQCTYICELQHEGATLYISRAVLEVDGTKSVLQLGRAAPVSWHYYCGDRLVSEIQYSPYFFRRVLDYTTEVATNMERSHWQISSNDGCWVQLHGEYNQFVLFYNGEDHTFNLTGGSNLNRGPRLGAMGIYTRGEDLLSTTMLGYDVIMLRAKLDGAMRVWTPGAGWQDD